MRDFILKSRFALTVLAIGACTAGANAQVLYRNYDTPALDSRNNSTAWLGTGGSFVLNATSGDTSSPLISQMMLDDIFFAGPPSPADAYNINSVAFKVANGALDANGLPTAMTNVRVYFTIYEDDNINNPASSQDGPGTQLARYDLGLFDFAAPVVDADPSNGTRAIASITDVAVSSATLGNLTLPFDKGNNQKFWFGLFFEQERNLALSNDAQRNLLGQVGVAFYRDVVPLAQGSNLPTGIGQSADVHYETAQNTGTQTLQRNRFNTGFGNGPNGSQDQYRAIFPGQNVNSNFAWLVNGSFNLVPEPGAGAFLLLGIPAFVGFVRRRRK